MLQDMPSINGINNKIVNAFRTLRTSKKITQAVLAEKVGISLKKYERIESGLTEKISVADAVRICIALGTTIDTILRIDPNETNNEKSL